MSENEAEQLIEQELNKNNLILNQQQKEKIFNRTGGIPLAIIWTIAKISYGKDFNNTLTNLANRKGDIAKFCFKEIINDIKQRDSYKILLSLALCKGTANRKDLGYIAGFQDDKFSCDEGIEELQKFSLINREQEKFIMLPLTKQYVIQELKQSSIFTSEAICRLFEYCLSLEQSIYLNIEPKKLFEYFYTYKDNFSDLHIKKVINILSEQLLSDSQLFFYGLTESKRWFKDWDNWINILKDIGGDIAIDELIKWIGILVDCGYSSNSGNYSGFTIKQVFDCIDTIAFLKEYELLLTIYENNSQDNNIKIKCIETLKSSKDNNQIKNLKELASSHGRKYRYH